MRRYCLALDLKDDAAGIAEYRAHHQSVEPEIIQSFTDTGIVNMEIYQLSNRLFMILETEDWFSFSAKEKTDSSNPFVQKWEEKMWKYQQPFSFAKKNEKWMLMEQIFTMK